MSHHLVLFKQISPQPYYINIMAKNENELVKELNDTTKHIETLPKIVTQVTKSKEDLDNKLDALKTRMLEDSALKLSPYSNILSIERKALEYIIQRNNGDQVKAEQFR